MKKERKANKSWGQLFYELGRNSNDIRRPKRRVRENNDNMTQNNMTVAIAKSFNAIQFDTMQQYTLRK